MKVTDAYVDSLIATSFEYANAGWLENIFSSRACANTDLLYVSTWIVVCTGVRLAFCSINNKKCRSHPYALKTFAQRRAAPKNVLKLTENIWFASWHSFSLIWSLSLAIYEQVTSGWPLCLLQNIFCAGVPTQKDILNGYTQPWPNLHFSPPLKQTYFLMIGFWMSSAILILFEKKRQDFFAFMTHHIVTLVLIGLSYSTNLARFGMGVWATHDVADIFLYSAKALHYARAPAHIVERCFTIFGVLFFLTRNVLFVCVYTVKLFLFSTKSLREDAGPLPCLNIFRAMFVALSILHTYWFKLIVEMAIKKARQNKLEKDIRSDDDDSDEDKKDT